MADMFGNAGAYERLMGRWSERLAPLFIDFAGIQGCSRLLDVGCGTGALVDALARRDGNSTIVGIDPSQAFIDYARHRLPDARFGFDVGDAMAMPYPDASFDASLSLLVFMFIPQPEKAAAEMRRVTRPGGTVAACVWDMASGRMQMSRIFWEEAAKIDSGAQTAAQTGTTHCNRAGDLTAVWRAAGLEAIEEVPLEIQTEFSSFDDYWIPFNSGVGPQALYCARLPAPQREALRALLRRRLLGDGPDGPFVLRAGACAVRGSAPAR